MEQKMLLPIVVVVLVAGFLIGFYAAGVAGNGRAAGWEPTSSQKITFQGIIDDTSFTDPEKKYKDFSTDVVLVHHVSGVITDITPQGSSSGFVLRTGDGKKISFRAAGQFSYVLATGGGNLPLTLQTLKIGDTAAVSVSVDAKTQELIRTGVVVHR